MYYVFSKSHTHSPLTNKGMFKTPVEELWGGQVRYEQAATNAF